MIVEDVVFHPHFYPTTNNCCCTSKQIKPMSSHKPVEGSLRSEEASSEWLSSLLGCTSSLSQHYLDFLSSSTPLLHPPKLEQDNDTLQTDLQTNDIHVNDEDRITAEIEVIKKNVLDEQGAKTPIVARPRSTSLVVPFFARRSIDLSFYRDYFVMLVERNAPLIISASEIAIAPTFDTGALRRATRFDVEWSYCVADVLQRSERACGDSRHAEP